MENNQKNITSISEIAKYCNLDEEFLQEYLEMYLDTIKQQYAKKAIFTSALALLFTIGSSVLAMIAGVVFSNEPLLAMLACLALLVGYSHLTSIDMNSLVSSLQTLYNKDSAIIFIIITKIGLYAGMFVGGLYLHVKLLMPTITTTNPVEYFFYWAYPLLVMVVAAISFALHNKHQQIWEIYQALRTVDVKEVPIDFEIFEENEN